MVVIFSMCFYMLYMDAVFSFDIGKNNLGYAIRTDDTLSFGIFDIDGRIGNQAMKSKSVTVSRIFVLKEFVSSLVAIYNPVKIIIEKQVQLNTIAMEIMYCLASICSEYVDENNLIIFDPKLKFTTLKIPYNTKNKYHKKLSISMCRNLLSIIYPDKLDDFDSHTKQDDISDAINMIYVHDCIIDNKQIVYLREKMV